MKEKTSFAAALICSGLTLAHPIHPGLSGSEKDLVCGVHDKSQGKAEGWEKIPANQAIFELRGFLQARGYLNPKIEKDSSGILVDPGSITHVQRIELEGDAQGIDTSKKRHVVGAILTPKLLTDLESWVKHTLSTEGYPCAEVKATGGADGIIKVGIKRGELSYINDVGTSGLSDLDPGVLRRYDTFDLGQKYNADLLADSADRAVESGVVERSFFTATCPGGEPVQDSIEGQPRIFSFGVSLNTEEVGVVQTSVKRTRIGKSASSAEASALASFKRQDINGYFDWKFGSPESRASLRPEIEAKHENENSYEAYSERAELGYATTWEALGAGMQLVVGPQFEYFESRRGSPTAHPYASTLAAELVSTGHEFEFNHNKLGGGFRLRSTLEASDRSVLSSFGATRFRVKAEQGWNVGGYDPAAFLMTVRGGYALTAVQGGAGEAGLLPPNAYQYLGGDSDLRGFGRLELGQGYPNESLSSAFLTFEISPDLLPDLLGKPVRPLGFVDAGVLSYGTYSFESPIYWSPGVGLSWYSPIGAVRATVARGIISGDRKDPLEQGINSGHWQVFVSLGEPL